MEPLLQVQDLTVCYSGDRQTPVVALDRVSFSLGADETLGILGESGCGKSTLALALLRLLPATALVQRGAVLWRGNDLLGMNERELQKIRGAQIALVHQEPGVVLNPVLRVGQQVAEVLRAHQSVSSGQARQLTKELFAQVGLAAETGIDRAYPHQLSGGQRQRVVIAQAIACGPALLIADEPTTALDAAVQLEILALLRRLQQQRRLALIFITHQPAVLSSLVQRVMVMHSGRIVEEGSAEQVLQCPLHSYTQELLRYFKYE